jgi:hypothetical protein
VFITAGPSTKLFTWGGGGIWCVCLWLLLLQDLVLFVVCVFITAVPNTKLCAWGEEDSGGHVLWDTEVFGKFVGKKKVYS